MVRIIIMEPERIQKVGAIKSGLLKYPLDLFWKKNWKPTFYLIFSKLKELSHLITFTDSKNYLIGCVTVVI